MTAMAAKSRLVICNAARSPGSRKRRTTLFAWAKISPVNAKSSTKAITTAARDNYSMSRSSVVSTAGPTIKGVPRGTIPTYINIIVINLYYRYNRKVKVKQWYSGQVSIDEAKDIQEELALQVSRDNRITAPQFIAGVDISVRAATGVASGAVVVINYPEMRLVEVQVVNGEVSFPYVPGLLSFRESPLALSAFKKLTVTPDLILVDGQGLAHPRRMGLACHLGLFLDTPTIGCAKSLLCGQHEVPGDEPGSRTELRDGDEVIGSVLRTRHGVRPVYVSIGHKIDLENAVNWVLNCCCGYRLPEPTRLAHLAAGGNLEQGKAVMAGQAVC